MQSFFFLISKSKNKIKWSPTFIPENSCNYFERSLMFCVSCFVYVSPRWFVYFFSVQELLRFIAQL